MAPCSLIVHADDFGLTKKVNEGIVKAYQEGVLSSTSLMANGSAFEHAVELYRGVPNLDLGIHLTLVEEKPILPPDQVSTLVDNKGRFIGDAQTFTWRYLLGKISLNEVRIELEAQIKKIRGCGLPISHLDSHQHLHMLPGVNKITLDLAKHYGIPAVRNPYERPRLYMLRAPKSLLRFVQLLVLNALCVKSLTRTLATTDCFLGFFYGGRLSRSRLGELLQYLPATGTCELMCHPGAIDTENQYPHWNYNHAAELEAICDPEINDWLQNKKINLTSYGKLFGRV